MTSTTAPTSIGLPTRHIDSPPPTGLGAAIFALLVPPVGLLALRDVGAARRARSQHDNATCRTYAARARHKAAYSGSILFVLGALAVTYLFFTANGSVVARKFFDIAVIKKSIPEIAQGFWLNIQLFVVVEIIVLVWALVVALARLIPGRPALPVRAVATIYVDIFRGMPAVIVLYLIAFGLPLTGLPFVGRASSFALCVFALSLVYGAYVAEVYRAGIESIHPSQPAAARSLGLSYARTLTHVILPQAIRRVIPPLLNDFISLQKDTSLVAVVGLLDGFNQSRIIAANEFNLSAVTGVGLAFVAVTVPMTRGVDFLVSRSEKRRQNR